MSTDTTTRQRRRFGLGVSALGIVLAPTGLVLAGGSGVVRTVGLAAAGYGIGFLVAGLFLAAGHNPLWTPAPMNRPSRHGRRARAAL
jgi:hypothetical protein